MPGVANRNYDALCSFRGSKHNSKRNEEMQRKGFLAHGAAIASCLALLATPALAGKADRARSAIAEARGKIDAANKLGISGETPRLQAEAESSLRSAQESLKSGHKERSIAEAHHASELADTALGEAQRRKIEGERDQRAGAEAAAAAALQQSADANARADAAQQDAAAARAAAATPVIVPPATTTTVTTQTEKVASSSSASTVKRPVKRVVKHSTYRPKTAVTEKTTTTVTTSPAQ
jgi:hypothetical protein